MRARIALEIVIQVRMGIEVQDRDRTVMGMDCFHDRKRDGVVTAKQDGNCTARQACSNGVPDQNVIFGQLTEWQVAHILKGKILADLHAVLAGEIAPIAPQRLTDHGRSQRRTTFERAVDVGSCADKVEERLHDISL